MASFVQSNKNFMQQNSENLIRAEHGWTSFVHNIDDSFHPNNEAIGRWLLHTSLEGSSNEPTNEEIEHRITSPHLLNDVVHATLLGHKAHESTWLKQ